MAIIINNSFIGLKTLEKLDKKQKIKQTIKKIFYR